MNRSLNAANLLINSLRSAFSYTKLQVAPVMIICTHFDTCICMYPVVTLSVSACKQCTHAFVQF